MTGPCFKLRHFNLADLSAAASETIATVAGKDGEICGGSESGFYDHNGLLHEELPYSGPFANLSPDDFLRVQSEFVNKDLIKALHSPDNVRFALKDIKSYIEDPQKRRGLIERLESVHEVRLPSVDELKCVLDNDFTFPTLHSDDTLIESAIYVSTNRVHRCYNLEEDVFRSFAIYYGLNDKQSEIFDGRLLFLNALMYDGRRTPEEAVRLLEKFGPATYFFGGSFTPTLKKHGVSDEAIVDLSHRSNISERAYAEPLIFELKLLGALDPAAIIKNVRSLKELFNTIVVMQEDGYSKHEIMQLIDYYTVIEEDGFQQNLSDAMHFARQNGVSFRELTWIFENLSDMTIVGSELYENESPVSEIVKAYIVRGVRTRAAVEEMIKDIRTVSIELNYRLMDSVASYRILADFNSPYDERLHAVYALKDVARDYNFRFIILIENLKIGPGWRTLNELSAAIAQRLEPWHSGFVSATGAVDFQKQLVKDFSQRLGIEDQDVAQNILFSGSDTIWRLVFEFRGEALMFDPSKMDVYRDIAKDLHNGSSSYIFFLYLSFDRLLLQNPPKTILDVAEMLQTLDNISPKLSENYIENVVVPLWSILKKTYSTWENPKTKRLDVTRHNIKDVNRIFSLFSTLSRTLNDDSPMLHEGEWLASRLDVEEIDVRNMPKDLYSAYYELIEYLQQAGASSSGKFLSRQMLDIDVAKIFGEESLNIPKIEEIRRRSNGTYPHMGDRLVDNLGIELLKKLEPTVKNIPRFLAIARTWSCAGHENAVPRDVLDLYRQYSYFAYQMVSDVILERTENLRDSDKTDELKDELTSMGVELDSLVNELERAGFNIREEGDLSKFTNRIWTNPGYTVTRAVQKVGSSESRPEYMSNLTVKTDTEWVRRSGVEVKVISSNDGTEVARALKCDRSMIGTEILLNIRGLVNTDARRKQLGARYIFSAPLTMTTTDVRTMTEMAYDRGVPMNWFMSARGKDGLLIVDTNNMPRILDKRGIRLSEMIDSKDLSTKGLQEDFVIWKKQRRLEKATPDIILNTVIRPVHQLADKLLFRAVMRHKSYSLLSGMLFKAGDDSHRLKSDGRASRRLFVEYSDGRFGIVDGTEYLTTEEAFESAVAAGATKAIYMDTGFWDQADYVDGKGMDHRLDPGHSNSSESTNRVIIRVK